MQTPRLLVRLLTGVLGFDVLLNLPRFQLASPIVSLLAPSIDLLVVAAVCWGVAQGQQTPRRGLRVAACVLLTFLMGYAVFTRFGVDSTLHLFGGIGALAVMGSLLVCIIIAAAAVTAAYLSVGLVATGFQSSLLRNVFLLVVALSAIAQVFTHSVVFTRSILARAVLDLFAQLRQAHPSCRRGARPTKNYYTVDCYTYK